MLLFHTCRCLLACHLWATSPASLAAAQPRAQPASRPRQLQLTCRIAASVARVAVAVSARMRCACTPLASAAPRRK